MPGALVMVSRLRFWKDKSGSDELEKSEIEPEIENLWNILQEFITDHGEEQWNAGVYANFTPTRDWKHLDLAKNVELLINQFRQRDARVEELKRHTDYYYWGWRDQTDLFKENENRQREEWKSKETEYKQQITEFKRKLDEAHIKHSRMDADIKQLKSQLESERIEHKNKIDYLRKEIEKRTRALMTAETATYLTDTELGARFSKLVTLVKTISYFSWTHNHSPWADEDIARLSTSLKRSQKWILSDTVWGVFQKKIFCTPFQVLGTEASDAKEKWKRVDPDRVRSSGKELDAELISAAGDMSEGEASEEEYVWPKASFESEEWRQKMMRTCWEAIEKPRTKWHQQCNELLEGYRKSIKETNDELRAKLEMVRELDAEDISHVEKTCEEAAALWVLFGAQKCRLVVCGYTRKHLVGKPELKRIGDPKGMHFDDEAVTVKGCEPDLLDISFIHENQ